MKERIEQLLQKEEAHLINYSRLLGLKDIQFKRKPDVKRKKIDICKLLYFKELECGGAEKAQIIAELELKRREKPQLENVPSRKSPLQELADMKKEIEQLKNQINGNNN